MTILDHVGIAVHSIAEARRFYESLDLEAAPVEEIPRESVRIARVAAGGSQIELLEPAGEDSPIARFLDRRGEGLHHIALRVEDVAETFERMSKAGIRMTSDSVQSGKGGYLYFFIHPSSAGGVLVEICNRPGQDADKERDAAGD